MKQAHIKVFSSKFKAWKIEFFQPGCSISVRKMTVVEGMPCEVVLHLFKFLFVRNLPWGPDWCEVLKLRSHK